MAEETAEAAANGGAKPERKPREEGPPIEELYDLSKPVPKVSVDCRCGSCNKSKATGSFPLAGCCWWVIGDRFIALVTFFEIRSNTNR